MINPEGFKSRYKEIKKLQLSRANKDTMGFDEADDILNDATLEMIELFRERYDKDLWFGNVNLYEETRTKPVLIKDSGQKIHNFEFSFMIPCFDIELVNMIIDRDLSDYEGITKDYAMVKGIIIRISDIGGEHLHWC